MWWGTERYTMFPVIYCESRPPPKYPSAEGFWVFALGITGSQRNLQKESRAQWEEVGCRVHVLLGNLRLQPFLSLWPP